MSTRRFRSVDDFGRAGVWLGVRCPGCGHTAVFEPTAISAWLQGRSSIEVASRRMRCTACGQRGGILEPVERDRPMEPAKPVPLPVKPRR